MLVDVVPMRVKGEPRPREELRTAVPARGHLSISPRGTAKLQHPTAVHPESVLPTLYRSRLHTMRGDEFVLHGIEANPVKIGAEAIELGAAQAWWCRLVLPGRSTPADPPKG